MERICYEGKKLDISSKPQMVSVLLHKILDLKEEEEIFLAEESWEDLIALPVTSELLSSGIEPDRAIEINGGLGIALHLSQPQEFWLLLTDFYSEADLQDEFRALVEVQSPKTTKTTKDNFFGAIAEYFSQSLAQELFCESCHIKEGPLYVEDRISRLASFLRPLIPKEASLLEICCGSGMATQSLYMLGYSPLSMELDRCELCQGLKSGKLDAQRSFVMDAQLLGSLFDPGSFDVVVGFMMGLIDQVNWNRWKKIVISASDLARQMALYTVYTQKEADLIAKALITDQRLNETGWSTEVIDNRDPGGIYDQWAVLAKRKC
jgi:hypothetical protein